MVLMWGKKLMFELQITNFMNWSLVLDIFTVLRTSNDSQYQVDGSIQIVNY